MDHQAVIAHTVGVVAGKMDYVDVMGMHTYMSKKARQRFLGHILPDGVDRITLDPNDFGSFDTFCTTLACIGRQPHRDPMESEGTTHKVASTIAELHEFQPVYFKAKSGATNPNNPTYTLGTPTRTTVEVVRDCGARPAENQVVINVLTPHVRNNTQTTVIPIDVIAAGLEPRGDTGSNTPMLAVGQQAVRGFVERALECPRRERNATGVDPADIFRAMCASGMHFEELGFTKDEIIRIKQRVLASLGRTCGRGATHIQRVTTLPPLCDTPEEAMHHINAALEASNGRQLDPDFEREYQYLVSLYQA